MASLIFIFGEAALRWRRVTSGGQVAEAAA
jgi:hypothetical protein